MFETLRNKIIKAAKLGRITEAQKAEMLLVLKTEERIERECTETLYKEAVKIYDSLIDQFYDWKTKYYVRHGESAPGAQGGNGRYIGHNLYFAQQFTKDVDAHDFSFDIDFSAKEMEKDYRHITAEEVMKNVLNGYRYKYKKKETWSGKYHSNIIDFDIDKATVYQAFNKFDKTYDSMWMKLYYKKWKGVK